MSTDRREDAALIEPAAVVARVTVDVAGLDALLGAIRGAGYRLIGPTVRDRAVVLDEIESVAELPAGWGDEQEGGTYRLRRRDDGALFGWAVGAHSWRCAVGRVGRGGPPRRGSGCRRSVSASARSPSRR